MRIDIEKYDEPISAGIELIVCEKERFKEDKFKEKKELKKLGFNASQDEVALVAKATRLFVGVEELTPSYVRSAVASAIRSLIGKKFKSIKIDRFNDEKVMQAAIEGALLGNYTFDRYKSSKPKKVKRLIIKAGDALNDEALETIVQKAEIVAKAVNTTRDIVNTPPDDCYPKVMSKIAKKIAKKEGLDIEVLDEKALQKEKMNALLAVARASRHKPYVVHLTYKPKKAKAKVVLVGKGLTYDSGGLSLKPSDFMVTMKADKSGASALYGIMQAVAKLGLDVEVHAFAGLVENMIGGDAYKPDDVLVAKNGKSIEVRNTDAEGRLVLADVLALAQERVEDADYIIDFATLTGACVVGLGEYTSGVMGFNKELRDEIAKSANRSGELANTLNFNRHLEKTLKSSIADICNISNTRYGGAITAGLFLSGFIEKKNKDKWVHVDIAGPAYVERPWAENPSGASGAGVRMTLEWLQSL